MKIAIPDDYQDTIHKLKCYSMIAHHDVTRYREPAKSLDQQVERLRDAEVVVSVRERVRFSRELLQRLPKLKLIALVGRSSGMIDFQACTDLGVMVSTGKSNSPESPSEVAIALILASRRNIALEAERMHRGELGSTMSHRVRGSTLGLFGFGAIGRLVAESGRGLGMKVQVWGRETTLERARAAGYETAKSKDDFFAGADVLSLHIRLTKETRGIVGPADLARMKPTALIVNTARAELIQPGALVEALKKGRPGYAALDVYEDEPVTDPDYPLLKLPNALCVPHIGWTEWDNFELYFTECFEQIVAYEKGETLRLANPDVKPRK